jgi:antirestriction protein
MSTPMTSPAQQLRQEIEESGRMDSQTDEFYQELIDHGIESLEQFEESYQGQFISEGDFVLEILNDCYESDLPVWVEIDYQLTWDRALSFDYFSIQTGHEVYEIFRNV